MRAVKMFTISAEHLDLFEAHEGVYDVFHAIKSIFQSDINLRELMS